MSRLAFWDRLVAVLLLVFAVYTMAAAREMGFMRGRIPGPGFAPLWIGAALAVSALAILAGSLRGRQAAGKISAETPGAGLTALGMTAVTIAAILLVEPLGLIASIGLLLLGLVRLMGGSWSSAALTAVGLPFVLYLVFGLWLRVPLPRGPWGF